MPLNFSQKRLQKAYLVSQIDPLVAPVFTGTDACLFSKLMLNGNVNMIKRPDITGSRSTLPGKAGKHNSTWSMEMSLAAGPLPGVNPDCGPILDSLFGAPGVIVAATSIKWTLTDALNAFAIARYRKPATLGQHIAYGCIPAEATFNLGGDVATLAASGPNVWTVDSDVFGNLVTEVKGGLATFPIEPVGAVTEGDFVVGFTGSITMGGAAVVTLKNAQVKIQTGAAQVMDTFNNYASSGIEADFRTISISFTLDDADDTGTKALKSAAYSKAGMDMSLQAGLIIGNQWHLDLKGIQLASPSFDDNQRRFRIVFGESEGHPTTISALDEVTLTIT